MPTAPRPTAPAPTPPPPAAPSLTERRKAATELEIARAAAALFAERGSAVTADDIARAAGVALRTFYRYFRTKEDAVAPLLAVGVRQWLAELRRSAGETLAAEADGPTVRDALERAARRALTPSDERAAEALRWTRGLLRVMRDDPALRAVWHRVHHDSEEALIPVLAEVTDGGPLEVRLAAAAANTAMRVAVETWAAADDGADARAEDPAELVARGMRALTAGLPGLDRRRT
ncbi:TetR family transcriptional regulator [Streptomyces albofaciens JCM 4342]|uniref:TetR family transcriptional regulator n=1 Tax=Streptomyces albofaciens TaxID=66866 RepID=UPI00123A9D28|nr:TetR family transcriptional regulator [Streptomyces albofaciens]KAA6222751.1 TetR family transcriptional regulator [Streptomyces albofaciens JCM 4342]